MEKREVPNTFNVKRLFCNLDTYCTIAFLFLSRVAVACRSIAAENAWLFSRIQDFTWWG